MYLNSSNKTSAIKIYPYFTEILQKILSRRRRRRIHFALSKLTVQSQMRVIDIGCGVNGRSFEDYVPADWRITGIDLHRPADVFHVHPNFDYVQGNAEDLKQWNKEHFDLAVCIGMLEHITDDDQFRRIVSELRRVAKQHVVIVPYRYCWIEPHFWIPFFPLLPYNFQIALVRTFGKPVDREGVARDPLFIKRVCVWRPNAEYQRVFPDSVIYFNPTLETISIIRSEN